MVKKNLLVQTKKQAQVAASLRSMTIAKTRSITKPSLLSLLKKK